MLISQLCNVSFFDCNSHSHQSLKALCLCRITSIFIKHFFRFLLRLRCFGWFGSFGRLRCRSRGCLLRAVFFFSGFRQCILNCLNNSVGGIRRSADSVYIRRLTGDDFSNDTFCGFQIRRCLPRCAQNINGSNFSARNRHLYGDCSAESRGTSLISSILITSCRYRGCRRDCASLSG